MRQNGGGHSTDYGKTHNTREVLKYLETAEAITLIGKAVPQGPATWADFGAGDGTFTRALWELLGPGSRIYAVDRDPDVLAPLTRWAEAARAEVIPVVADFTGRLVLPGLEERGLDGILLANALHFVAEGERVLRRLVALIRPGGRFILVEYDRRRASRWVPFPVPPGRFFQLALSAGLSAPGVVSTRPSAFGGTLYAAMAERMV